jgi:hypothetical protein
MEGSVFGLVIPGVSKNRSAFVYTEEKGASRGMRPSRRHLPQDLKQQQLRCENL